MKIAIIAVIVAAGAGIVAFIKKRKKYFHITTRIEKEIRL